MIAPRLADFLAAYPELEVEVVVRERIGNLVGDGFDAAVWFGSLADGHVCVLFVDPRTGLPFDWEFHQGRKRVRVTVSGRLLVNDVAAAIGACIGGFGIAQPMELSVGELLRDGTLVELFPRWRDERFPVYLYYPSRVLAPAKLRAFSDFIMAWSRYGSSARTS